MKNLVIASLLVVGAFAAGCGTHSGSAANKLTSKETNNGQSVLGDAGGVTGDQNVYDLLKTEGTGGTASFTGSVDGNVFTPAAAFYDVVGDANGTYLLTYVVLASDANFCTDLVQNHNQIKSSAHLVLGFESTDSTGNNLEPTDITQAFTITSNQNASGNLGALAYLPYDEACEFSISVNDLQASSGSIQLSKLDLNSAVGSFTATVGAQAAAVSGKFTAVACPGLAFVELGYGPGNFTPGCQ